ncbi:Cobalamin (vitamin B12)-binding domain protein [Acididesulfobacillus acetoxydans]|uniref:Cobalamin (Vitamin B12)-binding domain protein n=1 Tax=Acididesulfobacillus acetoxydans TaxID=1561005 RepID=A0A8S0WF24_9FIRM|nr:corrinoid protein [Acididesulfobacillus acetoxydans]CAA7600612.1 Cobalamin (vitamin B12)-binding domain protein [Acididesulfobacillus acetoxydans]CEJ09393.1 Dimethylamine corrinoid protein 3 [Acididesulfobacillus acetoxydans]
MSKYFEDLAQSVIAGQQERVKELTRQALDAGTDPVEIINQGLISGMNVVGARFKVGQMFVPEVLMSARAMNGGMELVKPLLVGQELPSAGKVVLGTVKGDLHDIGKNLVGMMLESAGFTVVNLGVDAGPEKFLQAIKEHKPGVIGLSALLTTTMLSMKDTIEVLKEEGLRTEVKVIVGGAPISQDFAEEIGADGFAPDAASATDLCKKLLA